MPIEHSPPAESGAERRREPRLDVDLPLSLLAGTRRASARVLDLSCSGARIQLRAGTGVKPPPIHTVQIRFGHGVELRCLARTVWHAGARYAVSFMALDAVDRLRIAEQLDLISRARVTSSRN